MKYKFQNSKEYLKGKNIALESKIHENQIIKQLTSSTFQ
jgi:hypothetical protein